MLRKLFLLVPFLLLMQVVLPTVATAWSDKEIRENAPVAAEKARAAAEKARNAPRREPYSCLA